MSSKSQESNANKREAQPESGKTTAGSPKATPRQPHPSTLIQRAKLDPKSLTPRDILQLQRTVGNQKVSQFLSQTAPSPRIQRDITVGSTAHKIDAKEIVDPTVKRVKGQFTTWGERSGSNSLPKDLAKKVKGMTKAEKDIKAEVIRLFKERYDNQKYQDLDDLGRQAEQDMMLNLLGLSEFEGIPQQLDQFMYNTKTKKSGPGNTKTPFRIYRTMPVIYWEAYQEEKDVTKILHGHGGGLGQALHYFKKSKGDKLKDDVLVEFSFSTSEEKLMDYTEISKGGEGSVGKGKKFGGKSEQNDVFDLSNIFSIDLGKNKELIASLKPAVRAVSFSKPERNKKETTEGAIKEGVEKGDKSEVEEDL